MELVIVTGMSGAGKSRAAAVLEDAGFYCIDNMPPALIPKFAEICFQASGKIEKVALVTDIRGISVSKDFLEDLAALKNAGYDYKMLFLNASDETLITRYKETMRRHPLADMFQGRMEEAIEYERELMQPLQYISDYVMDTSRLSPVQLREQLLSIFVEGGEGNMLINLVSFGFKFGVPSDADLVFDVRCLPNPFYVLDLKEKTGLSDDVYNYVFSFADSNEYFDRIAGLIEFIVPLFIEEGKSQVVIAIGCTGGKHRSVSFVRRLNDFINKSELASSLSTHRDISKT